MAGTEMLFCDYRVKETVTNLRDRGGLEPIVADHPALLPSVGVTAKDLQKAQ